MLRQYVRLFVFPFATSLSYQNGWTTNMLSRNQRHIIVTFSDAEHIVKIQRDHLQWRHNCAWESLQTSTNNSPYRGNGTICGQCYNWWLIGSCMRSTERCILVTESPYLPENHLILQISLERSQLRDIKLSQTTIKRLSLWSCGHFEILGPFRFRN